MTDRAKALIVHLTDDLRLGDADSGADRLMDAIMCLQGVLSVEPVVALSEDHMARERVRRELRGKLLEALDT